LINDATIRDGSIAQNKPHDIIILGSSGPKTPLQSVVTIIPTTQWIWYTVNLNTIAQRAISHAISRCIGILRGKPTVADVNKWPKAITIAPSVYPHASATKYPGHESIATVPVGLGFFN